MRRRQGTDRVARVAPRQDVPLEDIDVADERIETPEKVAATGAPFVSPERFYPCTNCGMAPMGRSVAVSKLTALSAGAALVRERFGSERP